MRDHGQVHLRQVLPALPQLLDEVEGVKYTSEKAVYDTEILKVKNVYTAVIAQAKMKREKQTRQSNRQEIVHSTAEADVLTSELAELLIESMHFSTIILILFTRPMTSLNN